MLSRILRLSIAVPLLSVLFTAGLVHADPPARVGRLALTEGVVWVHNPSREQWEEASVNWPISSGDTLYTDANGRAQIRVGSTSLGLDRESEIRIEQLDDERFLIWLERGSVALRLRSRDEADRVTIETRDGQAMLGEPGHYRVDYSPATTALTARQGSLEFVAQDLSLSVPAGRRVEIWHAGGPQYSWSDPLRDDFAHWILAHDQRDNEIAAPRYVSPEMTGAEDLAAYGDWHHAADYGPVWYPRSVPVGWVPYRHGHWVWVEPWGWTWVDEAPWGFAPFHYGRWVLIGASWAWVPGSYVARPVYAPALVAWIGSSGWSLSFSAGHLPAVGWFPLGPHDVFVPVFRASPIYVHRINIIHVTDVTYITRVARDPRRGRYAYRDHQQAVTVVPVDTIARGRPVGRDRVRDPQRWVRSVPIATALPGVELRRPDAQTRERSQRFDEQRQRRLDEDRSRHAERSRNVAPRPTAVPRAGIGVRPQPEQRKRPDAAAATPRQNHSGRQIQDQKVVQPRPVAPARKQPGRSAETRRPRETTLAPPAVERAQPSERRRDMRAPNKLDRRASEARPRNDAQRRGGSERVREGARTEPRPPAVRPSTNKRAHDRDRETS